MCLKRISKDLRRSTIQHIKENFLEELFIEKATAGTALILDYEQYAFSNRDGVIGHSEVQMSMGNKGSLFI